MPLNLPTTRLQRQGWLFCVAAVLVCLATAAFPRPDAGLELLLALGLMSVFGVPHGALDALFAARLHRVASPLGWAAFAAAYLVLAASVVLLWWTLPAVFLVGFLAVSCGHFSGDLRSGSGVVARVFYGASVVVLPTLLHAPEVTALFALLSDAASAAMLVKLLELATWPCLAGVLLSAVWTARQDRLTAIEMLAAAALFIWASPLFGFTVYFCVMHSARHTLRSQHYAGVSAGQLARVALWPLLALALLLGLAWLGIDQWGGQSAGQLSLDQRLVPLFFVTLAALTVPHMLLVERVRWAGWSLDTAHETPSALHN